MFKIGDNIIPLRQSKNGSQPDLAKAIEATRKAFSKFEHNAVVPSEEVAKNIADAFDLKLDFLVNDKTKPPFHKQTIYRLMDIATLKDSAKGHLFALLDASLRAAKTRLVYGS